MRVELTDEYLKWTAARSVPGAKQEGRMWVVYNPSPKAAAVICRVFPQLADKHPELPALRDTLMKDARPFDNATGYNKRVVAPGVEAALAKDGKSFYEFQALDLGYLSDVLRQHRGAEIAWERGLGKTLAACALIENTAASRTLIVCPNTAKEPDPWRSEVERFLPDHQVLVLPNPKGRREKMVEWLKRDGDKLEPFILIVHYEALAIIGQDWKRLGQWDLIVTDEAHRLANPATKMHRALMKVPAHMKLSMTGSMIQNHPEEIYGRLRWLFPQVYKSKWRDWNNRFLEYVESGYGKVLIGPNPARVDAMRRELGVFTVYRRKADELDLPARTEQTLRVTLNKAQRRAYDELAKSYVATLDSGETVVGLEPVVLLTRLRQVATGLELVSGEVADSSKLDVAVELIRDNPDDPFVCFSWFKPAAKALADRLAADGVGVHLVTGDTTHKQRAERIAAFQRGEGRVFVGTISTLGESVNLQRASQAIFLDRSWNPADNDQAADRIYRIGQENPVTITNIVAKDTVDEYNVLPTLANKEAIRRMILGGT